MREKKVCFIINTLSGGGGAERTVQNLSNYYSKRGMSVTIVLIDKFDVGYKLNSNIKVHSLDLTNKYNPYSYMKTIVQLKKILKNERFDYVYSFLFRANMINIITSKVFNISPLVISERSFAVENYKKRNLKNAFIKIIISKTYSKVDAIIAISERVKSSLISDFKVNSEIINVIYNPLPIVSEYSIKKFNKSNTLNLISIGRLIESKNQKELIQVVNILKNRNIDVHLSILGDGPLKEDLELYIKELNLTSFVFLEGFKSDIKSYLNESDIFIYSSKFEAFGNVIIEAMQTGLPIVSYNTKGGPVEIIEDNKFGILINDQKPKSMADEIINLINDSEKYQKYSMLSIERSHHFTIEKIANEYLNVIESINK